MNEKRVAREYFLLQFIVMVCCLQLGAVSFQAQTFTAKTALAKNRVDARLDKTNLGVYVTFEKLGRWKDAQAENEAGPRIYLRFRNNLKSSVYVKGAAVEGENEVAIFYKVKIEDRQIPVKELPEGLLPFHGGAPSLLLRSGDSILFSVPKDHLAYNLGIEVDFRSTQLESSAVFYYASDLPDFVKQKFKIFTDINYGLRNTANKSSQDYSRLSVSKKPQTKKEKFLSRPKTTPTAYKKKAFPSERKKEIRDVRNETSRTKNEGFSVEYRQCAGVP